MPYSTIHSVVAVTFYCNGCEQRKKRDWIMENNRICANALNRITANGVYLRLWSASNRWRSGSAKYSQRYILVSKSGKGLCERVRAGLSLLTSSIPEPGLRSVLISGAIVDCFFGLFNGANSSNPVKGIKSYNIIKSNTLCALKNKVSN